MGLDIILTFFEAQSTSISILFNLLYFDEFCEVAMSVRIASFTLNIRTVKDKT